MICSVCGYEGEARVVEDDGHKLNHCSRCGAYVGNSDSAADAISYECQEYIKAYLAGPGDGGSMGFEEAREWLVDMVRARRSAVRELMGIKEGE